LTRDPQQRQDKGQTGINVAQATVGLSPNDVPGLNPVQFAATVLSTGIIDLAADGGWHSCILLRSGRVYCWGSNENGALGLDDTNSHRGDSTGETLNLAPVTFAASITFPVLQVSAGYWSSCGTRE
jgi:alpha-tubulin suppressor-like RCC1 family protein